MEVLRYAAFSQHPAGGNPAGVVLDATGADAEVMQEVATGVGYSETAFLFPVGDDDYVVRYFSPLAEISFCGHATIAAAVAHAHHHGPRPLTLHTRAGRIEVVTHSSAAGVLSATLTSVATQVRPLAAADLDTLLAALRWSRDDLEPALPPRVAFAGAWHPVLAVRERERLSRLDYDFTALQAVMAARGWTTVDLVWRASATVFHCRNPFPPGGIVEDPATGAAAAALGGYLRALSLVPLPVDLTVFQGEDLGRPSQLLVHVPADPLRGVSVTGYAVPTAPAPAREPP
jgi:PhzF family phenazine biosynthesis protein